MQYYLLSCNFGVFYYDKILVLVGELNFGIQASYTPLMATFRKSSGQKMIFFFFSFSTFDFYGLIIVYTKAFSLWRRQKITAPVRCFNGWQLAKMKKSIPDMSLP